MASHARERIRDVPTTCLCTWLWITALRRWVRAEANPFCIWHLTRRAVQ
jgi:hypothetical protein